MILFNQTQSKDFLQTNPDGDQDDGNFFVSEENYTSRYQSSYHNRHVPTSSNKQVQTEEVILNTEETEEQKSFHKIREHLQDYVSPPYKNNFNRNLNRDLFDVDDEVQYQETTRQPK